MEETLRAASEAPRALLPDRPTGSDRGWHVLHVKSRQEKALSADLRRLGIHHYLPRQDVVRYHGGRKVRVDVPVFPGYLFLWGSRDEAFAADRTRRVANLIAVVDQELLEWELVNLHRALEGGLPVDTHRGLKEGTRVVVTAGPFKDLEGRVDRGGDPDRVVLQVSMLGSGVSLEVDGSLLRPIDEN